MNCFALMIAGKKYLIELLKNSHQSQPTGPSLLKGKKKNLGLCVITSECCGLTLNEWE